MHVADNVVKRYDLKQMDEFGVTQIPVSYTEAMPRGRAVRRVCKEKICCEFSMRHTSRNEAVKDKKRYVYKLTTFSGREKHIDAHSKELYCAVVACTTDSPTTCGKRFQPSEALVASVRFMEIKINMIVELETMENDYLVMPTNVDFSILPLDASQFSFERSAVYALGK